MSKPIIIGITGGIGGGKSTFSACLRKHGQMVYDTDIEARKLQNSDSEVIASIKSEFGKKIYENKVLNCKVLAEIVFTNSKKLATLNDIVHPAVRKDFLQWVEKNNHHPYLFMECAILYEGGFDEIVDKVIVVSAPEAVRMKRVIKRDRVSEQAVRARMNNQINEQIKIHRADWFYDTNNKTTPEQQVKGLLKELNLLSEKKKTTS